MRHPDLSDWTDYVRALDGESDHAALRDHLDDGRPLPDSPLMARIQSEPRTILGLDFDPTARTSPSGSRRRICRAELPSSSTSTVSPAPASTTSMAIT